MEMKKGVVVMNDGEEIIGGIVSFDADNVVLRLPEGGTAELPSKDIKSFNEDGMIVIDLKPRKQEEVGKVGKAEKKAKVEGDRSTLKDGSKLKQVVDLCDANPTKSRKELISMIVEAKIMDSAAGASTYHQNAKKYLLVNQPKA